MAALRRAGCLLPVLALAACGGDPPGFDTPESALHDPVADVYLVSNIHGAPTAKDGNGYIARVAPDGGMERHWIQGGRGGVTLHAPKGMALRGDELWVADIDVLRAFDRRSGRPLHELAIPGATFLNDVAVGPDGTVYCTDSGLDAAFAPTGTDAIWKVTAAPAAAGSLPTFTVEPLLRGVELGQPNGIVAHRTAVYVVSWRDGTFFMVDARGVRTDLGKAPTAQLDGLVRVEAVAAGEAPAWLATSWQGECVYRFDLTGGVTRLPATLAQPADFGFDGVRRRLLIPLFGQNRLEIVPL